MRKIIANIDPALIEAELTPERLLRRTARGGNEIYVVDAHCAPNTMRELGRLREIAFRCSGGGTGKECDIDEFDTMNPPCRQLLVWNPQEHCIIGGYRFIHGKDIVLENGMPRIATSHMFHFSEQFIKDYLPYTIELGRSFVRLEYQATATAHDAIRAIFALDNLWDGLAALTNVYDDVRYFFGKVTMYPQYPTDCRDMILGFLYHYFPDAEALVRPIKPLTANLIAPTYGDNFSADYAALRQEINHRGSAIPPLVNAYMTLSPKMRFFGTAINTEFGNVEESGILIPIQDINPDKLARHL